MVGIPGKSKGCHTCRKRKIKCDLQQPDCQRCIRSGRVCEGYNRGAVFLNRTTEGWAKRERLEEAQPRSQRDGGTYIPSRSQVSPSSGTQTSQKTPSEAADSIYWPVTQMSDVNVKKQMFHGLFLQSYLPTSVRFGEGMQGEWLSEALRLNSPGPTLEYAFQALSVTRVGRFTGHEDLIQRGKMLYGLALRSLYKALGSQKLAGKDETLAACCLLGIYEMFESTSGSTTAHEGHMAGLERLVQYRGLHQTDTPLGKALLKNICYTTMIMSIQYRKASRIKPLIDKIEWWDLQGKLFARGHVISALMEDLDRYRNSGSHNLPASAQYLKQCVQLHAELEAWYNDLRDESPSPMYWSAGKNSPPGSRLIFTDIHICLLLQDYWALRIAITATIAAICSNVPKEVPATFRGMLKQLELQHGTAMQLELATNIMESLSYCMRDEHGAWGSQKCIFAGRVALYMLRSHPPEHLKKYEIVWRDLTEKKGFRFARELEKKEISQWTPILTERQRSSRQSQ